MGLHRAYIGSTSGLHRAYIGSKSSKKYISGLYLLAFVSTSLNKRALPYVFPWDVVCLSGVFRVCEVADKKTIKHDQPRNINEYSRCTPGKIPKDLRSLVFSSRYYPIHPTTDSPPTYPKLTNMFVLFVQFADVGRTLGLHCRCLRMFPERLTLFTDVPSLFADVLTKPADLAIRGPSGPTIGTV